MKKIYKRAMMLVFIFLINTNLYAQCGCSNWYTQPTSASFLTSASSSGYFSVYATGSCNFYVQSSVTWLNNFTFPGSGVVDYDIDINNTCLSRTGVISLYCTGTGNFITSFTVFQAGSGSCSNWSISPASGSFSVAANSGSFNVNATGTCSFYASTTSSFINSINYPISGLVSYNIDVNSSCISRTGNIDIYENCSNTLIGSYTVYQAAGGSCSNWYTSPATASFPIAYSSGNFTVNATGSCTFYATPSATWINNLTFPGSGVVDYHVDLNTTCSSRTGSIDIYESCTNTFVTTISIFQAAPNPTCSSWFTAPASGTYGSNAGNGGFSVYGIGNCTSTFNSVPSASWINNITYPGFSSFVSFYIDSNTACTRNGSVAIYENCSGNLICTFYVTQYGIGSLPGNASVFGPITPNTFTTQTYNANASNAQTYYWTVPIGWTINSGQGTSTIDVLVSSDSGQVCAIPSNSCGAGNQGCLSVNATIGIDEYNLDNNVSIYPNPTKDKLYFKYLEIQEKTHITIENILGEKVVDSELKNPEINISNLPPSIYIVIIQNKDGLSLLKFLKE
jgi:hypothetical protein